MNKIRVLISGSDAGPSAGAAPEAAAADTEAAAPAAHGQDQNPAGGMNRHLWGLEGYDLLEGCDTSKPPSEANQV